MKSLFRTSAVVPKLKVANVAHNVDEIIKHVVAASKQHVGLVVFPELCITGYTSGDLFAQPLLLHNALTGLTRIAKATVKTKTVVVVGLPLEHNGKLYNVAAVIYDGEIKGLVPKSYLPNYGEFYEARWFTSGLGIKNTSFTISNKDVPFGGDLLFTFPAWEGLILGVEVCEDLWAPIPPSSLQSLAGATVIANLSASNELVGKASYRRALVSQQSARTRTAYIYAAAGVDESTTDVVFGGDAMIYENGSKLIENTRYDRMASSIVTEVDLEHLAVDRVKSNTFSAPVDMVPSYRHVNIPLPIQTDTKLTRKVDPHPFVPSDPASRHERTQEIFTIQATGLATRLQNTNIKQMIIGLSGGLDSTLALLVMKEAADMIGLNAQNLHAYTMPGFATSGRTKKNAELLSKQLGIKLETIDIRPGSTQQLKDIGHDNTTQDVTYENVQARYRTMILMNQANQLGGLVVGTGDLSEIALGWATFNGDHMSHYNVNASVPKTLIRHLVKYAAEQPEFTKAAATLRDILDTPISPELTSATKGKISQSTEDIIGPYELHDFFLYHFIRWGSAPSKILVLARIAFTDVYDEATIKRWLKLFVSRFFANQWKRSVMPDGPKVGTVALSPRGDWRMPSDVGGQTWLNELQ